MHRSNNQPLSPSPWLLYHYLQNPRHLLMWLLKVGDLQDKAKVHILIASFADTWDTLLTIASRKHGRLAPITMGDAHYLGISKSTMTFAYSPDASVTR